ncbi:MAG: hypothetical protein IJM73_02050, partial [Spirochaetales bacterium]|nr:hypothetical protein [Spirochaetales bacterium]
MIIGNLQEPVAPELLAEKCKKPEFKGKSCIGLQNIQIIVFGSIAMKKNPVLLFAAIALILVVSCSSTGFSYETESYRVSGEYDVFNASVSTRASIVNIAANTRAPYVLQDVT